MSAQELERDKWEDQPSVDEIGLSPTTTLDIVPISMNADSSTDRNLELMELFFKVAGQVAQFIAVAILLSQTPTIVLVLAIFVFLFGVMESGFCLVRLLLR